MDTTRLVRPLVGVCAVLCIADLVVMLSLAVYGGVTEKLWFTIACALSLTLLPLQVIPSLCIPGARWKTLGIAGSGMIGAFLATRALGTLTSMIFSLRAMEPATVPVVEAGHGQYHHTHEVQLPDGRIDTVGGWKGPTSATSSRCATTWPVSTGRSTSRRCWGSCFRLSCCSCAWRGSCSSSRSHSHSPSTTCGMGENRGVMQKLYRDDAIVLRTHPLGEADRIITLLTRRHGKVRAVAKGVRRTGSRYGSRLEPFTLVDIQLHAGKSLHTVTQVETIEAFAATISTDYGRFTAASAMLETTDRLTDEMVDPNQRGFLMLVGALRAMGEGRIPRHWCWTRS